MTDKQRLALLRKAEAALRQTQEGYTNAPNGPNWREAFKYLERLAQDLTPHKNVPDLGPVTKGGKSVLLQDLTHETGGFPNENSDSVMPAFDDAIGHPGLAVIAPEALTVTRQSSAQRRDGNPNGKAFYATGVSGIKYWFGHVDASPAVSAKFKKGQKMAAISSNHEAPHLHIGVDARALNGGKDLLHHTDYTHGAPLVGTQLIKALT